MWLVTYQTSAHFKNVVTEMNPVNWLLEMKSLYDSTVLVSAFKIDPDIVDTNKLLQSLPYKEGK